MLGAFLLLWASLGSPVSRGAAQDSVDIADLAFSPSTITVPAGTTVIWANQDSAEHRITGETGGWDSGLMTPGQSYSSTFATSGRYPYICLLHPFMRGTVVVTEAAGSPEAVSPTPPRITTPVDGALLDDFSPTFSWTVPEGATQYDLEVIPVDDDGPAVSMIGNATFSFTLPPPPSWFGLLPDMGYTWRVRVTDAAVAVGPDDPAWGAWSARRSFRTPTVSSESISFFSPAAASTVATLTPTLQWTDTNSNVFYYEVQISKQAAFGPDAFLYWELLLAGAASGARRWDAGGLVPHLQLQLVRADSHRYPCPYRFA